jgi:hypothetical protein
VEEEQGVVVVEVGVEVRARVGVGGAVVVGAIGAIGVLGV